MINIYTHFCQEEISGIPRPLGNYRNYLNCMAFAIFMPSVPLQISTRLKEVSTYTLGASRAIWKKYPITGEECTNVLNT